MVVMVSGQLDSLARLELPCRDRLRSQWYNPRWRAALDLGDASELERNQTIEAQPRPIIVSAATLRCQSL